VKERAERSELLKRLDAFAIGLSVARAILTEVSMDEIREARLSWTSALFLAVSGKVLMVDSSDSLPSAVSECFKP